MSTISSINDTGLARVQFFDVTGIGESRTFPSYATLRYYVDNGFDVRLRYTESNHVMYLFMNYKTSDRLIFSHVVLSYTTEYVNCIDVMVAHNDDSWDMYKSYIPADIVHHWPAVQSEPEPDPEPDPDPNSDPSEDPGFGWDDDEVYGELN